MWGRPTWPPPEMASTSCHGDGNAHVLELGDDLGVAVLAGLFQHRQALGQKPIFVVQEKPEDMHGPGLNIWR